MVKQAWRFGAALMLMVAFGCGGGPCAGSEDRTVPLSEFPCSKMNADGLWESHPWPPIADEECYWLEFRACSTYRVENPLAETPTTIIGFTSFAPEGTFSTVGSGNSFVIDGVTDSEIIIRNTQNQIFWLRLVLE
jgi:hypothetical protein